MNSRRKTLSLSNIVLLSLGIGILAYTLYKVEFANVVSTLQNVRPFYLVLAIFMVVGVVLVRMTRWLLIYDKLPNRTSAKIYIISKGVGEIAPAGTGELTRAYLARDLHSIPMGTTLAPAAIERVADIVLLLAGSLAFVIFFLDKFTGSDSSLITLWVGIAIAAFILSLSIFLLTNQRLLGLLQKRMERSFTNGPSFLNKLTNKVDQTIGYFLKALNDMFARKGTFNKILVTTILIWCMEAITQYLLFLSLGITLPIMFLWSVISLSIVVGTFSFVPGGLGFREATYVLLIGGNQSVALSVILIYRFIAYALLGSGSLIGITGLAKQ